MTSRTSSKAPEWGTLRGIEINEPFTLGDFEVKFDVSAIKGQRPNMEDRWVVARHPNISKNFVVFAVFDGHGGDQVSQFLSASFCDTLFAHTKLDTDPANALASTCELIDTAVCEKFPKPPGAFKGPGPGSTAIVALFALGSDVESNGSNGVSNSVPKVYIANVGDSRCVIADQNGSVTFESLDQRPSRNEERKRIEGFGGRVRVVGGIARAAGVLAVSRAFGNAGIKTCVKAEPVIDILTLDDTTHTMVLCSDGLTDVVQSDRIGQAACARWPANVGKHRRGEGSVDARPRGGLASSGYTPQQPTHLTPSSARRRSSSLGASVSTVGSPVGSGTTVPGIPTHSNQHDDGWWGSRRVASALTSLAKMRQSADNVCVLVCRARRKVSLLALPDLFEDGTETRKTTPAVTPVKGKTPTPTKTQTKTKTPTPKKTKTPTTTPAKTKTPTPVKKTTPLAKSETPVKTFSKSITPLSGPLKPSLSPLKTYLRRTPVGVPSSAKRLRGEEKNENEKSPRRVTP